MLISADQIDIAKAMDFCISLMLLAHLVALSTAVCPNSSTSAAPDFSNEFADIYYVRNGESIPLYCCAHGYDNITWWRLIEHSWESFPPLPDRDISPLLEEHQQVLRIFSAQLSDNTTFRCQLLKDSVIVKERELRLVVIACQPLARGPLLIPPLPQDSTIDKFGETIVFFCTGYFGCFNDDLEVVEWKMKGSNKELNEITPRYNITSAASQVETIKVSQFTIVSVQPEDLDRTFFCIIANSQETNGQTITAVKVFKKEQTDLVFTISVSVGSVLGAVIAVLLLVKFIGKLYGPQIRLYVNSRLPGLAPNPITVNGQEDFEHNAFIFHAIEDEPTAVDIQIKLRKYGYDVFICADLTANQATQPAYQRECCKSAMILFLYTYNLTQDPLVSFFLHGQIEYRRGKGIMFLEDSNNRPDGVKEWTKQVMKQAGKGKCQCVKSHTDNVVNNVIVNNVIANKTEQSSIENDKKFWKNLPRLKIPKKDASRRHQQNFEAALQNRIPRLNYQRTCKTRATAVEKPLIYSPSSNTTPNLVEVSQAQTSNASAASHAIPDHYCHTKQPEVMVDAYSNSNENRNDNPSLPINTVGKVCTVIRPDDKSMLHGTADNV